MEIEKLKEPFAADFIQWRVQKSGNAHGRVWVKVLAYVDARAVQNRLDEVVGPMNWTVSYQRVEGGVFCTLSIRGEDGVWVSKIDGSDETDIEAFKGGISKSLVRAASTWGIGRYLYDLPVSFADVVTEPAPGTVEFQVDGKWYHFKTPKLPAWALPGFIPGTITPINAPASTTNGTHTSIQPGGQRKPSEAQIKRLFAIAKSANVSHMELRELLFKDFNVTSTSELTLPQYEAVYTRLQALGENRDAQDPQPDVDMPQWGATGPA